MNVSRLFLAVVIICPLVAAARIGETPDESLKRYGTAAPATEDNTILSNATNQVFGYMGWQITSAYVESRTARIRYRKGRMVEETTPKWLAKAEEAGLADNRRVRRRAELAKLDPNRPANQVTVTVTRFKEDPLTPEEIKNILKSESPVGNWREYDPKAQSRSAVFSFTSKEVPSTLINDCGIVAHITPGSVTLEKLAVIQEFEKQASPPKDGAPSSQSSDKKVWGTLATSPIIR